MIKKLFSGCVTFKTKVIIHCKLFCQYWPCKLRVNSLQSRSAETSCGGSKFAPAWTENEKQKSLHCSSSILIFWLRLACLLLFSPGKSCSWRKPSFVRDGRKRKKTKSCDGSKTGTSQTGREESYFWTTWQTSWTGQHTWMFPVMLAEIICFWDPLVFFIC